MAELPAQHDRDVNIMHKGLLAELNATPMHDLVPQSQADLSANIYTSTADTTCRVC